MLQNIHALMNRHEELSGHDIEIEDSSLQDMKGSSQTSGEMLQENVAG